MNQNNQNKQIKCKCDDPGHIVINSVSTNVVCGIKGIVDQSNCRLVNGTATCVSCNTVIYEDK